MAQSKRTFNQARIERDLDDRIVPQGTYRDALNIKISTSDGEISTTCDSVTLSIIQQSNLEKITPPSSSSIVPVT